MTPQPIDLVSYFHCDTSCKQCGYTIFAADVMVVRAGKRYHAQCLGFTTLEQVASLRRWDPKCDTVRRDAEVAGGEAT